MTMDKDVVCLSNQGISVIHQPSIEGMACPNEEKLLVARYVGRGSPKLLSLV